jgi:hypothetical protein
MTRVKDVLVFGWLYDGANNDFYSDRSRREFPISRVEETYRSSSLDGVWISLGIFGKIDRNGLALHENQMAMSERAALWMNDLALCLVLWQWLIFMSGVCWCSQCTF